MIKTDNLNEYIALSSLINYCESKDCNRCVLYNVVCRFIPISFEKMKLDKEQNEIMKNTLKNSYKQEQEKQSEEKSEEKSNNEII
jgi:hypothetical protein